MNRAARGGDEVPVGPDAIDPPARVVHSLGRTADDRGRPTVPCIERGPGEGPGRLVGLYQFLKEDLPQNACRGDTQGPKQGYLGVGGTPVGPDDRAPTKLTVGIVPAEHAEATDLRRWFSEAADIRNDAGVAEEVLAFIDAAGARSIVMTDRIIGCPHEEGIDYQGPTCLACPFWAGRDRWTGKRLH
jgi:hypothetical protein